MSTFTNYLKLHKPGETEKYTVNVFNANAELLDSALARIEQQNEHRDSLLDALKTKATNLVDGLLSKEDHAKYEDASAKKHKHDNKTILDGTTAALISTWNTVSDKVDKAAGKGLSTNDYTTEDKTKLSGIEPGAKANVQADWNVSDAASDAYIKNKPDLTTLAQSVMTGASANAPGTAGNVPAPAKGKHNAYLRGDGTWQETSTSLTATVPGVPLDHTAAKVLKDQIDAQNSNLSELGNVRTVTQTLAPGLTFNGAIYTQNKRLFVQGYYKKSSGFPTGWIELATLPTGNYVFQSVASGWGTSAGVHSVTAYVANKSLKAYLSASEITEITVDISLPI